MKKFILLLLPALLASCGTKPGQPDYAQTQAVRVPVPVKAPDLSPLVTAQKKLRAEVARVDAGAREVENRLAVSRREVAAMRSLVERAQREASESSRAGIEEIAKSRDEVENYLTSVVEALTTTKNDLVTARATVDAQGEDVSRLVTEVALRDRQLDETVAALRTAEIGRRAAEKTSQTNIKAVAGAAKEVADAQAWQKFWKGAFWKAVVIGLVLSGAIFALGKFRII